MGGQRGTMLPKLGGTFATLVSPQGVPNLKSARARSQ